ncbi:MAG TPA: PDZ domain-containing protein, partial [Gammaproteobacteria bacterium]
MAREDKQALYLLGERLIKNRRPVLIAVIIVTAFFGWRATNLELITSFGDLLPQGHEFIKIHNTYSKDFGGANNIVMMVEVEEGNLFNVENLAQIYLMTEEIDKVYGVNHNQIDSIGHRTTRYLKVAAGGTLRSEPIMIGMPRTEPEAKQVQRIVHNSENVYGILVSLDDRAAIIRANFIEGRLDYRRIFEEMNERVILPFTEGWVGAQLVDVDPDRAEAYGVEKGEGIIVKRLFPNSAAKASGLQAGDVITTINGEKATRRYQVGAAVARNNEAGGAGVEIGFLREGKPETIALKGGGSDVLVWAAGEPRL